MVHLPDWRYEEIKAIAVNMLVRADVHSVPINGFEIAQKFAYTLHKYTEFPPQAIVILGRASFDSFSIEQSDGWHIYYNEHARHGRARYTILHELGHIALDHSEHSELAEAEANFFAKYAIAPPILIHRLGIGQFEEIEQIFETSHEMASNAWDYYQGWLRLPNHICKDYEIELLKQFDSYIKLRGKG